MTHPVLAAFDALLDACTEAAAHGPAAVGVALTPQGALPALYDSKGTRWAFHTWPASAHQRLALTPHVQHVARCGVAWRKATLKVHGLRELFGTGLLVIEPFPKKACVHWCPARQRHPDDVFDLPRTPGQDPKKFRESMARCLGLADSQTTLSPQALFDERRTVRMMPKTTAAMAQAYLPAMLQGGTDGHAPFVAHTLVGFQERDLHTLTEARLQAARAQADRFAPIEARLAALAAARPHDARLFQITGLTDISLAIQATTFHVSNVDTQGRTTPPRKAVDAIPDPAFKGWAHAILDVFDDLAALLPRYGTWQTSQRLFSCHIHDETPEDTPLLAPHLLGLAGTGGRWFAVAPHPGLAAQLVQARDAMEAAALLRAAGMAKIVHNKTIMVCEVDQPPGS